MTRLLDWSGNLLVALFFAVESEDEQDGVVWSIFKFHAFAHDTDDRAIDELSRTFVYMPKHVTPRITAQSGGFTVHSLINQDSAIPTPFEEEMILQPAILRPFTPDMEFGSLAKAIVPGGKKRHIRDQLDRLGVHRAALFPGLDGISDYIKRIITRGLD